MRILILSKKIPFPPNDGESIAIGTLASSINKQGVEIDLLSLNTSKHYTNLSSTDIPKYYAQVYEVFHDNDIKIVDAFKNLSSNKSYNIDRFISKEFKNKLIELLHKEQYDVIQFESIYLMPYFEIVKKHSNAITCLRAHNIEFEIWENLYQNERNFIKKFYLKLLAKRLKKFELENLNKCDLFIPISKVDQNKFEKLGLNISSIVCPVGISYSELSKNSPINALFFIGSLDWIPNIEGLNWFLDRVFPIIIKELPTCKINIAGRNGNKERLNINVINNIEFHGEVPDSKEYMETYSIMIVPLFSGSGMRVKIIEGMALKKTIITTSKGIEGIDARHEKEVLIADDPNEFASFCIRTLNDTKLRYDLGQSAFNLVKNNYDSSRIGMKLTQAFNTKIKEKSIN